MVFKSLYNKTDTILSDSDEQQLQGMIDYLRGKSIRRIDVVGHTDNSSPEPGQPDNYELSRTRAEYVGRILAETLSLRPTWHLLTGLALRPVHGAQFLPYLGEGAGKPSSDEPSRAERQGKPEGYAEEGRVGVAPNPKLHEYGLCNGSYSANDKQDTQIEPVVPEPQHHRALHQRDEEQN